jgi:hypothetical protein
MIKEGRMLVILEGLVLDIEPFVYYHPGGSFVLEQRIGFNLDLPFNAHSYSGIQSDEGRHEGYQHSNIARAIAQSLVIGKYGGDAKDLPNFPGIDGVVIYPQDQKEPQKPDYTDDSQTSIEIDYPFSTSPIDV